MEETGGHMVMLVIRRRRSPTMEECGRTTMDVMDDKDRKVKRGNRKKDDEVKTSRRSRRRGVDEMDKERG